jgi:ferric-dicitrate binding protein FerR (iron transport regulator)
MADPTRPSIVAALRRLEDDAALEGMPVGARHRIAARLTEEADRRELAGGRRRWIPALTFLAGAALVMLVVAFGMRREPPPSATSVAATATPRSVGTFAVEGDACAVEGPARARVLAGTCRLVGSALVASSWDEARVRPHGNSLEVVEGTVVFEVAKVPAGAPPVRVRVSHGRIEVLGTRFSVEQTEGGGHVDLFEGSIRFHGDDGTHTSLGPGERLGWGDEARVVVLEPAAPAVASASAPEAEAEPEATPARSRPTAEAAAQIIEQVEALRRRGFYEAAANRLRRALKRGWDRRTAEVLSYELGQILQRHLSDRDASCRHWAGHRARFGRGRYAGAVDRALEACAG